MMMRAQALLRAQPASDGRGDPRGDDAEPVPLRHAHAHPARGAARRRGDARSRGGAVPRRMTGGGVDGPSVAPHAAGRQRRAGRRLSLRGHAQRCRPAADTPHRPRQAGLADLPGSLKETPLPGCLDPHRQRRQRHRLHRQGGTRPGHQDRAAAGGRRGASVRVAGRSTLVTADTALTPNEGYTAGSHSMQDSGTAIAERRGAGARILLPKRRPRCSGCRREQLTARRRRGAWRRTGGARTTARWSPPGLSLHVRGAAAVRS